LKFAAFHVRLALEIVFADPLALLAHLPTMPSSGPTAQRRTRGYTSLVLAAAGLAAATGIALWYLRESNLLDRLWSPANRQTNNRKKKAVVVIVDDVPTSPPAGLRLSILQYISSKLPSFEVSRDYAELYLISGPSSSVADDELYEKVEHPTRLLHCKTPQGIIHITKHIKPDILLSAPDDGQPISELQGILLANHVAPPDHF
jgi:hypothetical protein